MRQRVVTFVVLAIAVISTAQLLTIILSSSPYSASTTIIRLFFISLFGALTCWLGILWYLVRKYLIFSRVNPSFITCIRQAGLVSLVTTLCFFFNTLHIFRFWDIIPLMIAALLIEFFFQADKSPRAHLSHE